MASGRKVVVYEFLTLDGVAENVAGFFTEVEDNEVDDAAAAAVIASQDAVIFGRRTYDEWVGFWPGSQIEPFATFINSVPKYVATSSPLAAEWAHARAIDGGLVEFVADLKSRPGGDVGVHGSISVAQTLLAAGVVDELRLVVAQTIAGVGRRLFDGLPPIPLVPIRSVVSPSGLLILDYEVVNAQGRA
ncbi:dihydrofolate reductase family protein [Cellulomonas sp. URHE0023]|uniref:dihydrofolate reductase family protein n=1 Tax=Cellulomonas sp. URHE0023 TaxID=1380354 RepID=UPI00048024CA|nr:dihydrofolate reductase family protein [Cellulomonas sp. URHE0023]